MHALSLVCYATPQGCPESSQSPKFFQYIDLERKIWELNHFNWLCSNWPDIFAHILSWYEELHQKSVAQNLL